MGVSRERAPLPPRYARHRLPASRGEGKEKNMPPPLLTLQDIHLTFGGTPLLEGAELAIGERERVCLVGRNGSGKSTLLKIAAGLVEADHGVRFAQPRAPLRYLPQGTGLSGARSRIGFTRRGGGGVRGRGPRPRRGSASRALSARAARIDRRRAARAALRRRSPPRGTRTCACTAARHPAARRADQPSRLAGHRMAGERTRSLALRAGVDQP